MGKGSNVAKANAARARNAKDQGKSKEEREASKAKAEKDRNAKKCLVCLQAQRRSGAKATISSQNS